MTVSVIYLFILIILILTDLIGGNKEISEKEARFVRFALMCFSDYTSV